MHTNLLYKTSQAAPTNEHTHAYVRIVAQAKSQTTYTAAIITLFGSTQTHTPLTFNAPPRHRAADSAATSRTREAHAATYKCIDSQSFTTIHISVCTYVCVCACICIHVAFSCAVAGVAAVAVTAISAAAIAVVRSSPLRCRYCRFCRFVVLLPTPFPAKVVSVNRALTHIRERSHRRAYSIISY